MIFGLTATAKDYYISNSGNDSNSGTDPSSPWQTLSKLNSFKNFSPGDNIYFKRGDTFYGMLMVNQSGLSGNPITYGAYGTGANPVITGFATIDSWKSLGGNIWQSASAASTLPSCNIVIINDVNTAMGRTPNTGYWTYSSSTSSSITSSSLNASTNWTGAQVVIKKERYVIDRATITSASGSTVNFTNPSSYNGHAGWGFFIQGDARTLDQQNEWYYNSTDKKIKVYSASEPANVRLATKDTLVYIVNKNYITFDGLSFTGANGQAFYIGNARNLTIKNCGFDLNYNAIAGKQFGGSSSNLLIDNCIFNHTNNDAINLPSEFAGATITNNVIKNTGMLPGLASSGQSRWGINVTGKDYLIQYNKVDTTGYVGIGFNGSNNTVTNNLVDYFCAITDDGGGLYTGNPQSGVVISDNIVLNGIGNDEGTGMTNNGKASGIYCDDNSSGMAILNNSIANVIFAGIFLHNANDIEVRDNTTFNCGIGLLVDADNSSKHTTGIKAKKNAFVANSTGPNFTPQDQRCITFKSTRNDIASFGTVDSNYYARPIDDNITIRSTVYGVKDYDYSLKSWQASLGFDLNSQKSPKTIKTADELRFEYNATFVNKTVSLGASYIDIAGKSQPVSVSLAPYSGKVLIRDGAAPNQAPTADAGSDKAITLPVNSVSLSGSGSDADGTIASYSWTKIAGPSAFSIKNATSATAQVSGLVEGVYKFELKVTDNKGDAGKDTVQVVVNAAETNTIVKPNIAPVAQAGNDTTVVAPVDFITLNGSGTDQDGQISSYLWKQISGPVSSILSQNNATATVSNLTAGTYEFELSVKDNDGAESKDTLKVTVALGRSARETNVVKVYPNPVHDIATVDINTGKSNTNLMIVIADISGKVVYKKNFVSPISNIKSEVNMSNLIKGTYIVTVYFDGILKQSVKVVKL